MDQSPPKRVTRSRAAAKANEPPSTTTTARVAKKATTASRAKTTRAASATVAAPTRTSVKRKLRSDDQDSDDEDELSHEPAPSSSSTLKKTTMKPSSTSRPRGRPKKIVAPRPVPEVEDEQPPKPDQEPKKATRATSSTASTRGRKKGLVEPPVQEEPVRVTRTTRTRKVAKLSHDEEPAEPATARPLASALKKIGESSVDAATTTGRTTTATTRAARSRGATAATRSSTARAPVKKSVKFEEPEKENVDPPTRTRSRAGAVAPAAAASGLRAKPVRKVAAAARTTRAAASTKAGSVKEKSTEKTPLSPRKVTQMPVKQSQQDSAAADPTSANQDPASEDELAMPDKTPLKKAPIKPPVANVRKDNKENEATTTTTQQDPEDPFVSNAAGFSLMGSPVRRLPQAGATSPFKDNITSPPKRVDLGITKPGMDVDAPAPSFKASLLQSPAKRPLFPMKRMESEESTTLNSPFKASLFKSPAKRGSPMKNMMQQELPADPAATPAPKTLALGTPLPAAISVNRIELNNTGISEEAIAQAMAGSPSNAKFSGRLSSILPRHADPTMNGDLEAAKDQRIEGQVNNVPQMPDQVAEPEQAAVEMNADADSELEQVAQAVEVAQEIEAVTGNDTEEGDPMAIDEPEGRTKAQEAREMNEEKTVPTPRTTSTRKHVGSAFHLRQKDLDPYTGMDSDSDDELADSPMAASLQDKDDEMTEAPRITTPTPAANTPKNIFSLKPSQQLGFTPLMKQLGSWRSTSPAEKSQQATIAPEREETAEAAPQENGEDPEATESEGEADAEGEDVEEEMEILSSAQKIVQEQTASRFDPFADVGTTEEDVALAMEANEMSLVESEEVEDNSMEDVQHSQDDTLSEASQEYGDENAIPIDPALLGPHAAVRVPAVTPERNMTRTFHTVSKVPLKPADDGSPSLGLKQRRASAVSRIPGGQQQQRPRSTRNATVISYSPTKNGERSTRTTPNKKGLSIEVAGPTTPEDKTSDGVWSTAVTPARTPRADVDPALLKGAVVFVDVHTAEGADASGIFVELLTLMGARCIKSWSWNPLSPTSETAPTSLFGQPQGQTDQQAKEQKIGVTHVVFKDGGKRTLEKVRESGGVVQCVGVSWVLDCERENEWLDESPYLIDTSLIPRGGARRRKSMEPRALANLNGTLVSSNSSGLPSLREAQSAPTTPNASGISTGSSRRASGVNNNSNSTNKGTGGGSKRRESSVWVRTPEKPGRDGEVDEDEDDWSISGFLTPVPKTPAPEKIAEFAANVSPGSASDWTGSLDLELDFGQGVNHTVAGGLDVGMMGMGMGMGPPETPQGSSGAYTNIMGGMGAGMMGPGGIESPLAMGAMTCPPKQNKYAELGQGVLGREKDERVLMRLMAARRKSLQFAPKVGSPLARAWK